MSSVRHRWSLGSLLLLLGETLAVIVKVHQDSINATVGQSVLLPVSYRFSRAPRFPVPIFWKFSNSRDTLITCTIQNCSLDAGGAPSNCSENCFPHAMYRSRAELFPENASLLLRDLQLSDSGVYTVTFRQPHETGNVTLTVHEQRGTAGTMEKTYNHYYVIGICSSVFLLLLLFLLFCCIRRHGAAQQQKRRITKQQVSSAEESHMESTAMRDMAIVYARIGDSFEQPQLSPAPEVVYTSITAPGPPGQHPRSYNLLV